MRWLLVVVLCFGISDVATVLSILGTVPIEVWGIPLSTAGALFFVSENEQAGWSIRKRVSGVVFGAIFGWCLGYLMHGWLAFKPVTVFSFAVGGVIGFNVAGGFSRIGRNFRRDPLKTVGDVSDVIQKVNVLRKQHNEESGDRSVGGDDRNNKPAGES